jgi:hypothetical protein
VPALWLAVARGLELRRLVVLAMALLAPIVTSHIAIQLRTPDDREVYGHALANGVLVGLVLPVSCLGAFLADRSCWLQPGTVRRLVLLRAGWFALLSCLALGMGFGISRALVGRVPAGLLVADTLLLWGLCALSAVVVGGRSSWMLPALTALVFSVPGLVPLSANVLSLSSWSDLVLVLAMVLTTLAGVLFAVLDEWRLNGGLTRSLTMGDELE